MWHIFKAEISNKRFFFIFGNLLVGSGILFFSAILDDPVAQKILKPVSIGGVLAIASLAMGVQSGRAQEKRDRHQSLLPIPTQNIGIARLSNSICFWASLLFWIQIGVYLNQHIESFWVFIINAGSVLALAATLSATMQIVHDYMYNLFTAHPSTGKNPLIILPVAIFYLALTLTFMQASFGVLGWEWISPQMLFSGSPLHLLLFICLGTATIYISSLIFTKRYSYLV